jgi:hypothetical protein
VATAAKDLSGYIHLLFIQQGNEKNRKDTINENFYYACIYDILEDPGHPRYRTLVLNLPKAKIVRLNSERAHRHK